VITRWRRIRISGIGRRKRRPMTWRTPARRRGVSILTSVLSGRMTVTIGRNVRRRTLVVARGWCLIIRSTNAQMLINELPVRRRVIRRRPHCTLVAVLGMYVTAITTNPGAVHILKIRKVLWRHVIR